MVLIVDRATAGGNPIDATEPVVTVDCADRSSGRFARRRRRRGRDAVTALVDATSAALVLARRDDHELRYAARSLGREVVTLVGDLEDAARLTRLAAMLVGDDRVRLVRALHVLGSVPGGWSAGSACTGRRDVVAPGPRPRTVARLAARRWMGCDGCGGGGHPGGVCNGCARPLPGVSA